MSTYIPKHKDGRAKTPFYHYDFVLTPAGSASPQRFCGSTGQKKKAAANAVETAVRELAALGKLSNLTTLVEATERYMREVGNRAPTAQARRQQQHCMTELLIYYGEETPLVAITPDMITKAAATRAETETVRWKMHEGELLPMPTGRLPSPSTVNRQVIQPMRRVLRRAAKHWGVPINIAAFEWGGRDGMMYGEPDGRVREMSTAEEIAFWPRLHRDYAGLCELYIISGRRQSNWVLLRKDKVKLAEVTVAVRILKKRRQGEKTIQLTDRELEIIKEAWDQSPPDCPYVFTAESARAREHGVRRPITTRMLYDHVKKATAAAGIKDFRPHDFRHTFGSRALRSDGNLKKLMQAMDHSSIQSTLRYVHVMQDEVLALRASVKTLRQLPDNVVRIEKPALASRNGPGALKPKQD